MNGRELEGMTSFDLTLLHIQIVRALRALIDQRLVPRKEQIAKQRKEVKKVYQAYICFLVVNLNRCF